MRTSKFTEEQIIGYLKQAEAGMAVAKICRKGGLPDATFCEWRAQFGGMEASDAAWVSGRSRPAAVRSWRL